MIDDVAERREKDGNEDELGSWPFPRPQHNVLTLLLLPIMSP